MKWRFFRHLQSGGDADDCALYRWHIERRSGVRIRAGVATDGWKRSIDEYVTSATALFKSMDRFGFLGSVPVDPDGELLDGSHRVACAVALGMPDIPVAPMSRKVWAPAWDYDWFKARMTQDGLDRVMADWAAMRA